MNKRFETEVPLSPIKLSVQRQTPPRCWLRGLVVSTATCIGRLSSLAGAETVLAARSMAARYHLHMPLDAHRQPCRADAERLLPRTI